jgi:predicted transcriptional regulator
MTSEFLENYKLAEPTVRKLYDSGLRLGILDALKGGPMRLADLRRAVNANAPNTSSKAKELEEMGLIERVEGDFKLAPFGEVVLSSMETSMGFYAAYEKFKDFWSTHRVEGIPREFLQRLYELDDSVLLRCSKENPIVTHEAFMKHLATVKDWMHVFTPIMSDEWAKAFATLLDRGVRMELTYTESVLRQFAKVANQIGKLKDFDKKAKFFINKDIGYSIPAFLASDTFFCTSLESRFVAGNYFDMKLESTNPKAIKWAEDLYRSFDGKYKPVKLSDYL